MVCLFVGRRAQGLSEAACQEPPKKHLKAPKKPLKAPKTPKPLKTPKTPKNSKKTLEAPKDPE